jgi:chromosome segregation ATPase
MQIEANYSSAPGESETTAPATSEPIRTGGRLSSNRQVAIVQADYVALANDLEQAKELTSALELQLSGKCNELAQFKHLWERTRSDMQKFEHDLEALRKERHALANQVQLAYATEHKLEKLKREHEELTARAEVLESELTAERILHADARRSADALTEEVEFLRRRATNGGTGTHGLDPNVRTELQMLRNLIDKILGAPASAAASSSRPRRGAPEPENIDIAFGT